MFFVFFPLGDNVNLDHAYIWSNVHISSNVAISQSVVCDRVVVKEGVTLNKQCVLAFNVSRACFCSICLPPLFLCQLWCLSLLLKYCCVFMSKWSTRMTVMLWEDSNCALKYSIVKYQDTSVITILQN